MSWFAPLFSSMAVAVAADEKAGAVASTVMLRAAELGDALPASSVAVAVIAKLPSVSGAVAGTVKDQVPLLLVVVVPRELLPSAKSSTVLPASAVPVKVGVEVLVRLSELELPLSEVAIRSGVEGAAGPTSSRSLIERFIDCSAVLPASSVAMTVKE